MEDLGFGIIMHIKDKSCSFELLCPYGIVDGNRIKSFIGPGPERLNGSVE